MTKDKKYSIPFNQPYVTGHEFSHIRQAIADNHLSGNGAYTKRCQAWLEAHTGCHKALLTHSCTAALEMMALLLDCQPGDEVIMPSYTFVSTANAFLLHGATPVFVDIDPATLNIDPEQVEAAINARTRAVVCVHYAGVGCAMQELQALCTKHQLMLLEDAAQGVMAFQYGQALGSFGALGALSFHETKNLSCGEGGALLINDPALAERAEVLWEKGTNRGQFFRGEVDKYTWVDKGSSYLPSELNAAFLWAQFEQADAITEQRLRLWQSYHTAFAEAEAMGWCQRPFIPPGNQHNAHMYYLLLPDADQQKQLLRALQDVGVYAVFHYVPLHSAPAGKRYGRVAGVLSQTDSLSQRLLRLPLWVNLPDADQQHVVAAVLDGLQLMNK